MDLFNILEIDGVGDFFKAVWGIETVRNIVISVFRLGLAALLSGIIGYEREHSHRPAGLRTHVLVSVGAALIMMSAVFAAQEYGTVSRIDITRMSASVIGGIGFIGVGTILREGFSVKGLTTAASIWAVACVGTAVGIGFYEGAVVGTLIIYFTLHSIKKILEKGKTERFLYVEVKHLASEVPEITNILHQADAVLQSMEIVEQSKDNVFTKKNSSTLRLHIYPKSEESVVTIVEMLNSNPNILDVYVES